MSSENRSYLRRIGWRGEKRMEEELKKYGEVIAHEVFDTDYLGTPDFLLKTVNGKVYGVECKTVKSITNGVIGRISLRGNQREVLASFCKKHGITPILFVEIRLSRAEGHMYRFVPLIEKDHLTVWQILDAGSKTLDSEVFE